MIGSLWIRLRRFFERLITGQSLQGRLALLTAVSVAFAVLFVGGTAYLVTRLSLMDQLDRELLLTAQGLAALVAANPDNLDVQETSLSLERQWVAVVEADGRLRVSSGTDNPLNPEAEEIAVARMQTGYSTRTLHTPDGLTYRVVAAPVVGSDGENLAVLFARPLEPLYATLASLRVVILFAGLAGVFTTTVATSLVARAALAPVRRLSQAVKTVTQTDQLNPIRIYGRDDLGELTQSFNVMLRTLQSSREKQRQLIADAGHELRTPLTSMRTNIELLLADDRAGMLPPGARFEILEDVSAQLGEFSALIGDLVALTRDDHLQREPELVDMAEVTEAALSRVRRRGPGITFEIDLQSSQVLGDAAMLERAIINLLDNAVKFSPADGTVWVTLNNGVLTITDSGEGIAEEDLPHIFDRFYRSDRSRNTPGTGLGLAIVSHTADAHQGTIRASNLAGVGAVFTLRIPTVDTRDAAH